MENHPFDDVFQVGNSGTSPHVMFLAWRRDLNSYQMEEVTSLRLDFIKNVQKRWCRDFANKTVTTSSLKNYCGHMPYEKTKSKRNKQLRGLIEWYISR